MKVFIAQLIATGLTMGGVYSLIAVGLHLVYNATGVFNMSQGGLVAWGGILLFFTSVAYGFPLWMSFIITVSIVVAIAIFLQLVAVSTVRGLPHLVPVLNCLFFGVVLDSTSGIVLKGQYKSVPPFSGGASFQILGAGISPQSVWVLATTCVILVSLLLFFRRSTWGRVMVANADNPEGIKLIGANPSHISLLAFVLGGAVAAIAGLLISPLTGIKGEVGLMFTLKGFAAAMVGGITSTIGVISGGFLIGLFEAFIGGFVSSSLRDAFVYSLIIFILVVRPTGIMGRKEIEKV